MILVIEGTETSGRKELSHFFQANGFIRIYWKNESMPSPNHNGIDRYSHGLGIMLGMLQIADASVEYGSRNDFDVDFVFDGLHFSEWANGFGGYSLQAFMHIDSKLREFKAKLIYVDRKPYLESEEFQRTLMNFLFDQSSVKKCRYDLDDLESNKLLRWVRK